MNLPRLFIGFQKEAVVSPMLDPVKYRNPTLKAIHRVDLLEKYCLKIKPEPLAAWENGLAF
jgi:hypothetical protein